MTTATATEGATQDPDAADMPSHEPVAPRGTTYAFAVATCALVVAFAASAAPIPLFNTYREQSGLTNADTSMAVVTYFAGTILALLCLGRLASHLGRKVPSLAALGLLVVGSAVLLHVPSVPPLLAGRFLMGLGCGLASSALMAYLIDTAPARPAWLASVVTSQSPLVGLTAGALASGALVEYGPAPRATVYLGALAVLAVSLALLARAADATPRSPGAWASLRPRVALPRRTRALLPAAAAVFVATWALGGFFQAFGPSVVADQLHTHNAVIVAAVFAAYMAPGVIGATAAGRLAPARGQRVGMAVFLLGVVGLLAGLYAGSVVAFLAAAVLAAIGQGAAMSASVRGLLHGTPQQERSPVMAGIYLLCYLGAMVPSLVAGQLSHMVSVPVIATGYGVLGAAGTALVWVAARDPR